MRIAYQGVAGAYSHIASMTVYPGQEYLPCDTFEKAMKLVSEGEADLAMIPVENSNAGRVSDVHFLLPQTGLHIIGEFFLPINHQLLGLPGTKLADVKSASSHGIKPTARIDTALSCQDVLKFQDKSIAAIASKLAGEIYGLDVVAPNIENARNNTTRFLIMAREPEIPEDDGGEFITSFIFKAKNIPAALYKALGGFATNGINITKLESYLLEGKFVSAQFYAEIESHPSRKAFQNAFDELKFFSESIHVLGTYRANKYRYL